MLSCHVFLFFYYCFTKLIGTYIYLQFYILFATHFSSISELPFEITFSLKDTLSDRQLPEMTQKTVYCRIHKSMSDCETQPTTLSFPYRKGRFLSKDSCLHLCQHSHSPTWAHLILTDGSKTYFEELWHRPSHAVMITRPNSSLKNSRDFIFFEEAVRCISFHFLPDTWFCWLSDDLLQDTSIYKILSSLAMTHKLLLSDPLKPYMKINFILWGRCELHDCFPIYRWIEKPPKQNHR